MWAPILLENNSTSTILLKVKDPCARTRTHIHTNKIVNSFSFARTRMTHVSDYTNTFLYYTRESVGYRHRGNTESTVKGRSSDTPSNRLGYFLLFTPLNYHYYCQSLLLRSHYQRLMDLIDTFSVRPLLEDREEERGWIVLLYLLFPFFFVLVACCLVLHLFRRLLTLLFLFWYTLRFLG